MLTLQFRHRTHLPYGRCPQEWEGPEVASAAEVSQSLEDIMLERFPELEPLLLQSSFTNKQAAWRAPKSGHASQGVSRGHSLGSSREASFSHSRSAFTPDSLSLGDICLTETTSVRNQLGHAFGHISDRVSCLLMLRFLLHCQQR